MRRVRVSTDGVAAVALAVALICGGCGAPAQSAAVTTTTPPPLLDNRTPGGPSFHVTSDDDAAAANVLAVMMRDHPELGFVVLSQVEDRLGVQRGNAKFLIQPRMRGPGEINRIIVIQLYAVKDEYRGREQQLKDVCYEINSTYDFITTYVQPTLMATLFVAQSQLTFGDDLTLAFFGKYLDELKRATMLVASRTLVAFLK